MNVTRVNYPSPSTKPKTKRGIVYTFVVDVLARLVGIALAALWVMILAPYAWPTFAPGYGQCFAALVLVDVVADVGRRNATARKVTR